MQIARYFQIAVVALFVLTGCAAPTQKMSSEDRSKVTAVRISDAQPKAQQLFLMAPSGANIGMMFGVVGAIATSNSMESATDVFRQFAEKNNISIEKIVREEVTATLRESGKLQIAAETDANAPQLSINIQQYGFGVTHLLGSKVVPVMMFKCEILDQSGKVLWQAGDRVLPSIASPFDSVSWEQMRDKPEVIEQEWRKAARYLAKKIISEL
jgi:hypothetical protein